MDKQAGRTIPLAVLAALVAVWVMILQAALPAPAIAASTDQIVICTLQGAQTVTLGADTHHPDAADCRAHCLAATLMPAARPPEGAIFERLSWSEFRPDRAPPGARVQSRVWSRPPGQGPPASDRA